MPPELWQSGLRGVKLLLKGPGLLYVVQGHCGLCLVGAVVRSLPAPVVLLCVGVFRLWELCEMGVWEQRSLPPYRPCAGSESFCGEDVRLEALPRSPGELRDGESP